jgi:hypothetical protein
MKKQYLSVSDLGRRGVDALRRVYWPTLEECYVP